MKLLKEIKDKEYPVDASLIKLREASRAILFDKNNQVPLLNVAKFNYHKLPGGGVEEGEDRSQALIRECFEETGSKIEIESEVGMIIEFRSEWNLKQTSYCFLGRIIAKGEPSFTEEELSAGFEIKWMSLDDAIKQLENDIPSNYEGNFIQERDLEFLKSAKKILTS